jgi:hypothetical protein
MPGGSRAAGNQNERVANICVDASGSACACVRGDGWGFPIIVQPASPWISPPKALSKARFLHFLGARPINRRIAALCSEAEETAAGFSIRPWYRACSRGRHCRIAIAIDSSLPPKRTVAWLPAFLPCPVPPVAVGPARLNGTSVRSRQRVGTAPCCSKRHHRPLDARSILAELNTLACAIAQQARYLGDLAANCSCAVVPDRSSATWRGRPEPNQ